MKTEALPVYSLTGVTQIIVLEYLLESGLSTNSPSLLRCTIQGVVFFFSQAPVSFVCETKLYTRPKVLFQHYWFKIAWSHQQGCRGAWDRHHPDGKLLQQRALWGHPNILPGVPGAGCSTASGLGQHVLTCTQVMRLLHLCKT